MGIKGNYHLQKGAGKSGNSKGYFFSNKGKGGGFNFDKNNQQQMNGMNGGMNNFNQGREMNSQSAPNSFQHQQPQNQI